MTFKPPADTGWLKKFNWITSGETKAPFLESFKLYLPRKTFPDHVNLRTKITLASTAASRVDLSSDVNYDLPLEHSHYFTTYSEGNTRCPLGKDIANPYSLCGNLKKICDTTARIPGKSMMPKILTTWKVRYDTRDRQVNNQAHVWDAPNPATNLLVIGKVKLRYLPDEGGTKRRREVSQNLGCCTANKYRPLWNDIKCEDCPTNSVAGLRRYYCEAE